MFDANHVTPITEREVNMNVVMGLLKHPDALKELYDWIILPDHDKFKDVTKHLTTLAKIQKPKLIMDIWRGIDPSSGYQDTMGLKKSGVLWFGKLNHQVGDIIEMVITKPLSFTDRKDIAAKYGSTIIEIPFSHVKDRVFIFTKELYYAIALNMNVDAFDVHEVILLPKANIPLKFKVVAV